MGAEISNRDQWLLKYKGDYKIHDTHYVIDLYVIPMIDEDGSGIRDEFEMQLARMFCPSLKLNVNGTYCFPEPVNIMGGKYNSKIYVTWIGDSHNYLKRDMRADLIDIQTDNGFGMPQ